MVSKVRVEVVYATPKRQYLVKLFVDKSASVEHVIQLSALLILCPEINLGKNQVGIYGSPVDLTDIIKDGDRVEIYRPLINDPKELRRQRAEKSGKK